MKRRTFLKSVSLAAGSWSSLAASIWAAQESAGFAAAAKVLQDATRSGLVSAAVMHVRKGNSGETIHLGAVSSGDAMFLLGSITKPIAITALMTLFDQGRFALDEPAQKYLPDFRGDGCDKVTIRHLLTHVSGLPDQLAANNRLRAAHAGLDQFVAEALRTPLEFAPGTRYQYSSMAILLACHIAERLSGKSILDLVEQTVIRPLRLQHAAAGLGTFRLEDMVPVQTERAAPESGAGDPAAKNWDWNSSYWRKLGAPWGGFHFSAGDLATYLAEFLYQRGRVVQPETARLMTRNHNPAGLTPRGLGFNVGAAAGSPGCSEQTFGHTGSTGTIAWADPASDTICVVLTSLPGRAVQPHPRELAAAKIAAEK